MKRRSLLLFITAAIFHLAASSRTPKSLRKIQTQLVQKSQNSSQALYAGPLTGSSCPPYEYDVHCVAISSLPSDFCYVTEQPNWCADHVGEPWCICDWAYRKYKSSGKSLSLSC